MTSLFGHNVRSELLLLYVVEALACFLAVYFLLTLWAGVPAGHARVLGATVALVSGIISGASGLYQTETLTQIGRFLSATLVAVLLFVIALPVLALLNAPAGLELDHHLAGVILAVSAAVVTTRLGFAAIYRTGALTRRVLVVRMPGGPPLEIDGLNTDRRQGQLEVAATIMASERLDEALDPARLREMNIWAVVVDNRLAVPRRIQERCARAEIEILTETELQERELARVDIERLPPDWLSRATATGEGRLSVLLRRALDILLGAMLLLLTLPLLAITAIAIKLDSPGPVFYRQERVGRDNKVFMLFKFRSMRVDAEVGGEAIWAKKNDNRVTRVGRLIRLTRIDEIPQVFNVLRGDMAFVGPRPERPAFVEQLGRQIPHYHDRAAVRPGITGWAQVNYPYGASVEDARMKLAYDLYYVRRRSLFLDLLILVATVRVILFQEGAR